MHTYHSIKDVPQNFSLIEAVETEQMRVKNEISQNDVKEKDIVVEDFLEADADISTDGSEMSENEHNSVWLDKLGVKACLAI